jgi:hypothetical protein
MKKFLVALLTFTLIAVSNPASAEDSLTKESVPVIGVVDTSVGPISVWRGDLPKKVFMAKGSNGGPCGYISFPIEALLPYSQLDTLNGPEVSFEIWSADGNKIGDKNIYRFSWNPVGPLTKVEIFNCGSDGFGDFVMIVKTKYQVSTTGLISKYFESSLRQNITVAPTPSVPSQINVPKPAWTGGVLKFNFARPTSDSSILHYEVGYRQSKSSARSTNPAFSSDTKVLKKVDGTLKSFSVTKVDVKKMFTAGVTFNSIVVRAVSEAGPGKWSDAWYVSKSDASSIKK